MTEFERLMLNKWAEAKAAMRFEFKILMRCNGKWMWL